MEMIYYSLESGPEWIQLDNPKYGHLVGIPSSANLGENVCIISVTDGVNPPVSIRIEIDVVSKP